VNSRDHDDQVADAGVSNDRVQLLVHDLVLFRAVHGGRWPRSSASALAEIGILASAAIWLAPFGRILTGWLSDRWGAPTVFAIVLTYVGIFSIASAFAQSYAVFFVERLIVATAGITFVIGIQHVSEWFDEEQLGTAEESTPASVTPVPPAVRSSSRACSPRTGAVRSSRRVGERPSSTPGSSRSCKAIVYYTIGEAAKSDAKTRARQVDCEPQRLALHRHPLRNGRARAGVRDELRPRALDERLAGDVLPEGFNTNNLVLASTFAATFSVAAGLFGRSAATSATCSPAREEHPADLHGSLPRAVDVRLAVFHRARDGRDDAGWPDRPGAAGRRGRLHRRHGLCVRRGRDLRTGAGDVPRNSSVPSPVSSGASARSAESSTRSSTPHR